MMKTITKARLNKNLNFLKEVKDITSEKYSGLNQREILRKHKLNASCFMVLIELGWLSKIGHTYNWKVGTPDIRMARIFVVKVSEKFNEKSNVNKNKREENLQLSPTEHISYTLLIYLIENEKMTFEESVEYITSNMGNEIYKIRLQNVLIKIYDKHIKNVNENKKITIKEPKENKKIDKIKNKELSLIWGLIKINY